MNPQDMTGADWRAYINFHGPILEAELELVRAAFSRWAKVVKACEAYERPFTVEKEVGELLEFAQRQVPQEVRVWLENTTGPRLALEDEYVKAAGGDEVIAALHRYCGAPPGGFSDE